jgi:hypothetical protein
MGGVLIHLNSLLVVLKVAMANIKSIHWQAKVQADICHQSKMIEFRKRFPKNWLLQKI